MAFCSSFNPAQCKATQPRAAGGNSTDALRLQMSKVSLTLAVHTFMDSPSAATRPNTSPNTSPITSCCSFSVWEPIAEGLPQHSLAVCGGELCQRKMLHSIPCFAVEECQQPWSPGLFLEILKCHHFGQSPGPPFLQLFTRILFFATEPLQTLV